MPSMRQQLIATLHEPSAEGGASRMQTILDKLIHKAADGDLAAIREIFDRYDGKAQAAAAVDDGERNVTFEWRSTSSSSANEPSPPAFLREPGPPPKKS